ncbi:hypothetical protein EYV94_24875 [Puteibacter caeruleilacunae]|nr:hypothetical protein EYV94_24875 [Puteibacter caeruleilacunae]
MKKSLVVYYSHSGITRKLANKIIALVGADSYEVKPIDPYPKDVFAVIDIFKKELQQNLRRPIEKLNINVEEYDTIYIGTPNWGNTVATPLLDFFSAVNIHDKKIIPFVTHGGGGVGNCARDIVKLANAKQNVTPLVVGSRGISDDEIENWLQQVK